MSVSELRQVISEVLDEKIEALTDPDYGLEFREEFVQRVLEQKRRIESGEERGIPFEEVLADLGIDEAELRTVENDVQAPVR